MSIDIPHDELRVASAEVVLQVKVVLIALPPAHPSHKLLEAPGSELGSERAAAALSRR